jgi:FkbM family methyltransferase
VGNQVDRSTPDVGMAWKEPWYLKIRRRVRKPFNKAFHGRHYFTARYRGADFLLQPTGVGTLEISAGIAEYPELSNYMKCCSDFHFDVFLDIGANIGLYSCILLKNRCVPRAILFEPDRQNVAHLRANLLINGLLGSVEVHEVALGDAKGRHRLVPGAIDGGFSKLADADQPTDSGYEVDVVRFDDVISFSNRRLAIKMDVENYECKVLAGMERTLRQNECMIQIEAFETRDQVTSLLAAAGYDLVASFPPNFVFHNLTLARDEAKKDVVSKE